MNFKIVKKNLEERGYIVSCFETAKEAAAYMDTQIDGKTVGFGGSMACKKYSLPTKCQVPWHENALCRKSGSLL